MRQKRSEILQAYIENAKNNGIDVGTYKQASEEKKAPPTQAELFNVHNVKSPFSELIEKAHPRTVAIAPAYDKLNGVIENGIQRQSVMVDLARRTPRGTHLLATRYIKANEKLTSELVKAAFAADNADMTDLMELADGCVDKLDKRSNEIHGLYKKSGWPAILIPAAIAAGVGYALYNLSQGPAVTTVKENAKFVLNYTSENLNDSLIKSIHDIVSKLYSAADKFESKMEPITQAIADSNKANVKEVLSTLAEYDNALSILIRELPTYYKKLDIKIKMLIESSSDPKAAGGNWFTRAVQQWTPSYVNSKTNLKSWVGDIGAGFEVSDYDEIKKSLPPLLTAATKARKLITDIKSSIDNEVIKVQNETSENIIEP
jgi:hypothetical protein